MAIVKRVDIKKWKSGDVLLCVEGWDYGIGVRTNNFYIIKEIKTNTKPYVCLEGLECRWWAPWRFVRCGK